MPPVSEEVICLHARARIAEIFGLAIEEIRPDMNFASDFQSARVSDFLRSEFDQLNDDIRDVANRKITTEINSGALVINTIADYCNHMVRCYYVNPKEVVNLLGLR